MGSGKPLLKVYADFEATRKDLNNMKVGAKALSFVSALLVAIIIYLFVNEIKSYRITVGLACLVTIFFGWAVHHSIPSYEKEHRELPLLYSFYKDGFVTHRSGHQVSWEQVRRIDYSKSHINVHTRNVSNIVQMSFGGISPSSLSEILRHIQTHAPERLSLIHI